MFEVMRYFFIIRILKDHGTGPRLVTRTRENREHTNGKANGQMSEVSSAFKSVRGQVTETTRGGARTKSASNNTHTSSDVRA